ncbi:hypothetical protein NP493_168g00035 [Ridgeia piscesae]|uniref:Uncharacterized protein n=1 Tax=Ridgeia piscesae TaxID=27915 RepID=A0AAD9P379_RIDPI|nr:hypothetical protein NP493_168g00035 [Ridgeia piscesae]
MFEDEESSQNNGRLFRFLGAMSFRRLALTSTNHSFDPENCETRDVGFGSPNDGLLPTSVSYSLGGAIVNKFNERLMSRKLDVSFARVVILVDVVILRAKYYATWPCATTVA